MLTLPEIRVGNPISHESISVFPLEAEIKSDVHYVLSDEALGAGTVTVEEVGEAGSVPELVVNNDTDDLVGVIMDALEAESGAAPAGREDAERLLSALRNSSWEHTTAVGVGDEYRYGSDDKHASALVFDETVVHGSLVVAG